VAGLVPPTNLDGPVASPPVHSLVRCAPSPAASAGRWELGFRYRADFCPDIATYDPHCYDAPDPPPVPAPTPPPTPGQPGGGVTKTAAGDVGEWLDYLPVLAETVYQCDSTGWTDADEGAALRQLEAGTPKAVGYEFWTGEKRPSNRHLASTDADDVTPVAGTPTSAAFALAALIQALANCGGGGRGMIHVPPFLATTWACANCLIEEGGCLVTRVGHHIVVPDPGYPGTGPDGGIPPDGATWAYATGIVQVLLGAPQVLRPDAGGLVTATVGASHGVVNAMERRAERAFAAWWGCCHAAVLTEAC